jgi:hypothetical protein
MTCERASRRAFFADKVTVVAKKIIAIHYGRAPEHSYFVGFTV